MTLLACLTAAAMATPLDLTPYFAEATPHGEAWRLQAGGDKAGALAVLRPYLSAPEPADGPDGDPHERLARRRSALYFASTLTSDPAEQLAWLSELEGAAEWAPVVALPLGRAAEATGDVDRAIRLFRSVPVGAPAAAEARQAAARALMRRKRYDEALLLLDGVGQRGRLARVDVLEKAGRRAEAVAELQALWAASSSPSGESELAERLARLGARVVDADRFAKGATLTERREVAGLTRALKRRFPKAGRAVALADGLGHLDAGRTAKAVPLLVRALGCGASYCRGVALDALGHALLARGDKAGALKRFSQLAEELPDHPDAAAALAQAVDLSRRLGDPQTAQQLAARLAGRFGTPSADANPEGEWLVAFSAYRSGDRAAAARHFHRLAAQYGRRPHLGGTTWWDRASYWEARSLELSGQRDAAGDLYEAVVQASPLTWYSHLAWSRLQALDAARAETVRPHAALERQDPAPLADLQALGLEETPDVRLAAALVRCGLHGDARRDLEARARLGTLSPNGVVLLLALRVRLASKDPLRPLVRWGGVLPRHPDGPDERLWRVMYPLVWWSVVSAVSDVEALDPYLALAVIRHESRYNPEARSDAGAHGLMQLLVATARELAQSASPIPGLELPAQVDGRTLKRPEVNIRLGVKYLRGLSRTFDGNVAATLAAYNAGPGRVRRWLREAAAQGLTATDEWVETIPIRQAQAYVKAVAGSCGAYRYIYGSRNDPRMRNVPISESLPR